MCYHPYTRRDPKTAKIYLCPCGRCLECRKQYQTEWIFRLSHEVKHTHLPCFVTLTYDEEHVPWGDFGKYSQTVLVKSDLQKFLKRLRKNGGSIMNHMKYFAVGEYGGKQNRCHFHLVIMAPNLKFVSTLQKLVEMSWRMWNPVRQCFESIGFVNVKLCKEQHIQYVCKYMNKIDERPHLVKPFRCMSKGLGLGYLSAAMIKYYLSTFNKTCKSGKYTVTLPRYFRKKLDEISLSDPMLKKLGMTYSEMCREFFDNAPDPGSRFGLFRAFQQRLQRLSDFQEKLTSLDCEFPLPAIHCNWNHLFTAYMREVPLLVEQEKNAQRFLSDLVIRNGLTKSDRAVQPYNNFVKRELELWE